MSLAFKLLHLLSHGCTFNGLPALENNIDSDWFVHNFSFFKFHLFGDPISQYGTPKWSSSDITAFCAQMQPLKEEINSNLVKRELSLLFKATCKYILHTKFTLIFLYIHLLINP